MALILLPISEKPEATNTDAEAVCEQKHTEMEETEDEQQQPGIGDALKNLPVSLTFNEILET